MKQIIFLLTIVLNVAPLWSQSNAAPLGREAADAQRREAMVSAIGEQVHQMDAQLGDWADLHRYRSEDAKLVQTSDISLRVVFYGASITDNWGRRTGSFFPGKPYVNRGISGQTTPQMLVRFQQDVVHLHPAVVVVLAGTNDIAGNTGQSTPEMIEDNFASMAAIAKQSGIRMVIASILPATHYFWSPAIHPVDEIRTVNRWLKQFCAQNGLVYLDYYDSMVDSQGGMRQGYSSDGVHPTAEGYRVMTPLTEEAIQRALSTR